MTHKTPPPNTTLGQALLSFRQRSAPKAVIYKKHHKWISKNWSEYYQDIETLGAGLLSLGLKPKDRVAIMSNTRYEWSVTDYGVIGIHGIVVSIYQNNAPADVEYILNNSEARVLFLENEALLKVWAEIKDRCPSVEKVILFESQKPPAEENILAWEQLAKKGREFLNHHPLAFEHLCGTLKNTDTATLLYTSGTTGLPKGVVITQTQVISEVSEAFSIFDVGEKDVSLTFLPYAHVLGRIEHWAHAHIGFTMAYAESLERMRANLHDIKPTFLIAVPRIFEKIYSAISTQMDAAPLKKKLFAWAVAVGRELTQLKITHQTLPLNLLATYELAKKLVLGKVHEAFGGRLRFAISGGAPLSEEISSFFHATGILILEGYGLTETTAAVTVNTPFNYKFGSVGRPIGDVEIQIAEDGEVLIRSHKVMKEYYKNPEATAEAIKDGWFYTGDIGEVLQGGDLKITDRKKDLIKTAGGKYIAPQKLEGLMKLHPLITQALICGDQKKYIVALVTLDPVLLKSLAQARGDRFTDWTELVSRPWVQDLVREHIAKTNAELASYETIKRFLILPTEFTVEGGELSPSLKLKRKYLTQKYQSEIDSLYT